jgi:hypothetical protein
MSTRTATPPAPSISFGDRLRRRRCALAASAVFVGAAMFYLFAWYPAFYHAHLFHTPGDIWLTYQVAGRVAHGHLGTIYERFPDNFLTFPAIVFLLAPLAALTSGLNLVADVAPSHIYAEPNAWLLLAPYILLVSTVPLFACDALAEKLGVTTPRRLLLAMGEIVAVWMVVVGWGHPEDAIATGLALYALLLGIDRRWYGAAWLLGLAIAFQPLVIVTLPLLLVLAGRQKALGFVVRAAVAPVAVLLGPVIANFHLTVKTLIQQQGYPNVDYHTPWTSLAPYLFGHGPDRAVAAGPGRIVLIVLACGVAWWAQRWRDRPEMLVWAFALVFVLRPVTESVMLSYYLYPALAVGILAAARSTLWRFASALALSAFLAFSSQWHLPWAAWWFLNVGGTVLVVVLGVQPEPAPEPVPVATGPASPRRSKVESKFESSRGRGAARRKQAKRQRAKRR